ncbi:stress response protein AzuC [Candidatus Sodalis pierantonius]|nr:stress response protein AzuC [Candidatus Sodalis pierantonius]
MTAVELMIGNKPNWSRNKMKFRNFIKKILASYLNTVKDVPPGAMM